MTYFYCLVNGTSKRVAVFCSVVSILAAYHNFRVVLLLSFFLSLFSTNHTSPSLHCWLFYLLLLLLLLLLQLFTYLFTPFLFLFLLRPIAVFLTYLHPRSCTFFQFLDLISSRTVPPTSTDNSIFFPPPPALHFLLLPSLSFFPSAFIHSDLLSFKSSFSLPPTFYLCIFSFASCLFIPNALFSLPSIYILY